MTPQARSEATRTRLLSAALQCFAEQGYESASVASISEQAGVSKGAFYHHFASKQALFAALLEAWLSGLNVQATLMAAPAASPLASLRALADTLQQALQDASGRLPLAVEFYRQAARDPDLWQTILMPFERYQALFAEWIAAGIAEGVFEPCNPHLAAQALVSLAVGLLVQSAFLPAPSQWEGAAEASISLLLNGLIRRSP